MPGYAPKDPSTITTLDELKDFVSDELGFVSQQFGEGEMVTWLRPSARPPAKPREGMILYADGTNFDPGSGKGTYEYNGTAWVRQTSNIFVNITDYGGIGDGTTDNSAALTAAIAAAGARGGTIYFPRGVFNFATVQTVNYVLNATYDLTLLGDGTDATQLLWPAGVDGLAINFNSNTNKAAQSFHLRDLSIVSADNSPSQIGILLNQSGSLNGAYTSYSEFTRVNIMGSDGPVGSNGWGTGIKCVDVSNVQLSGCALFGTTGVAGTGISWQGTNSSNFATGLYLNDCAVNQFTTGILMLDFVQGMYLTACQINGCTVGVNLTGGASNLDSAVSIVNSEFGQYATGSNAITMTNPVAFFQIDSTNFNMATVAGPIGYIILGTTRHVQITNCSMVAAGWPGSGSVGTKMTGISLAGTVANTATIIANNIIAGFFGNGTGVNASVPIVIQASAHDVIVCNNFFVSNQFITGQTCINNSGGANIHFSNNFYDNGYGPINTADTGDSLHVSADKVSTIIGLVNNAFGVNIGNQNNSISDHGLALFAGASTTSDASTIFIDFLDASANLCGSITRNDTGSVRGVSFNGNAIDIQGGITACNLFGNVTGTFQLNFGNKHASAGDHGANCYAGTNTTSDTSSVFINFVTPNSNQCGAIVRNDTGATRQVTYNTTSDIRLKKDIRQTERGLAALCRLRVIDYAENTQAFLAQEVAEVYPEAVRPGGDDPELEPWMMDYGRMTPLLVQAIKDLSDKVDRLEKELESRSNDAQH